MTQMLAAAVSQKLRNAPVPVHASTGRGGSRLPLPALHRDPETHREGDVNFASIMDLDASGGWQVVRLASDGQMLGAEPVALKVLREFFPGQSVRLGSMPEALTGRFLESRNWGLSQAVQRHYDRCTVTRSGLQLTIHFIPEPDGGYLLLKTTRQKPEAANSSVSALTGREREVVALVAAGKTNIEIGILLQISSRTVQKHLENIFQKLGVETRTAVAVRALTLTPKSDFVVVENPR